MMVSVSGANDDPRARRRRGRGRADAGRPRRADPARDARRGRAGRAAAARRRGRSASSTPPRGPAWAISRACSTCSSSTRPRRRALLGVGPESIVADPAIAARPRLGARCALVTLGAEGVVGHGGPGSEGEGFAIAGERVDAADTSGAGDVSSAPPRRAPAGGRRPRRRPLGDHRPPRSPSPARASPPSPASARCSPPAPADAPRAARPHHPSSKGTPDDCRHDRLAESRIARLEDIDAINRLKARYAQCCDDGYDEHLFARSSLPDGAWIGPRGAVGREAIADFIAPSAATRRGRSTT